MAWVTIDHRGIARAAWTLVLGLSVLSCTPVPVCAADVVNLALNKPACSSSVENEEHSAARANDGDPETCWRADDEPEDGPEWWQVDLRKPFQLSGCRIRWPFDGKRYRYKVEGSADRKNWSLLSDQTNSTATSQVHNLKFQKAGQVRYVKITVTGLDEGCWVSISEVQVFGLEQAMARSKRTASRSAVCHSERSEESAQFTEILRFAQDDVAGFGSRGVAPGCYV
ncbi:MAG: discoidin domain-containing protein [Thermoguttaceae bacterium]